MFETLMMQIDGCCHPLSELVARIDEAWASGQVDDEQKAELLDRARTMAKPSDQWASNEDRIEALEIALKDLVARVSALESTETETGDSTASDEVVEEWHQPLGAFDAYDIGSKVLFGGKVWKSTIPANVWSPAVYPQGWEVIE